VTAEVVVYAATSAGVCAAVAAAEAGARVVLLEPGRHVGGMTSGGLGYTDVGDVRVIGGPAARFRQDVADHYGVPVGRYAGPEPRVAEAIFRRRLDHPRIEVVFGFRIGSVSVRDGRIASVTGNGVDGAGRSFGGGVFVDASYEGDLLALAGVPYAVGRESRSLHGEQWAGRQELLPGRHTMPPWVSPFVNNSDGPLLPGIRAGALAPVGAGDGGVMRSEEHTSELQSLAGIWY
jgi:hypothetical protein